MRRAILSVFARPDLSGKDLNWWNVVLNSSEHLCVVIVCVNSAVGFENDPLLSRPPTNIWNQVGSVRTGQLQNRCESSPPLLMCFYSCQYLISLGWARYFQERYEENIFPAFLAMDSVHELSLRSVGIMSHNWRSL